MDRGIFSSRTELFVYVGCSFVYNQLCGLRGYFSTSDNNETEEKEMCPKCSSNNYRILKCLAGDLRICKDCGKSWNYNKDFKIKEFKTKESETEELKL